MISNEQNNRITSANTWKLAFILLFLFSSGSGYATNMEHRHDSLRMDKKLKLTPDQKTKMSQMRTELKKSVLPLQNLMDEKRAHLQTLQTAENADLKLINATIDEMQELQTKILKLRASHQQEIRKMLTPEQRIKFDTARKKHRKFPQGKGRKQKTNQD